VSNKFKAITVVVQVIGLYETISVIVGVPALITLIINIWHSLTNTQQIILVTVTTLILVAIGLFIYGQVKKRLYRIPEILHQMHKRTLQLSSGLSATAMSQEDFADFMSLIKIDASQLFSSIGDLESLKTVAPKLVKTVETQTEKVVEDEKETGQRAFYLMYDRLGLRGALDTDRHYQKSKQSLDKLMPTIPTEEISKAVLAYEKSSRILGAFWPLFCNPGDQVLQILPLQYKIDRIRLTEQADEKMALLLSKVREAINKYYKGG